MRIWQVASLALMAGAWVAAPADACHRKGKDCCAPPCCEAPACAPAVQYVEQTVTCYRTEVRSRQVPVTCMQVVPRVEVVPQKVMVKVPVWTETTQMVTEYTRVPREVVREVTRCRMVPVTCVDSCTGCCRTSCKPETYVEQVRCTVWDCVPVQKAVKVPVCSVRMEERTVECKKVICETKPVTIMKTECYCVKVPYQTTVRVAVCPPAPGCCH